jgi:hypothetical protein
VIPFRVVKESGRRIDDNAHYKGVSLNLA